MYKFKIGTEVQGADYIQGNLVSIAEGKIIKRKRWSGENWYTLDVGNIGERQKLLVFLEDEIEEIKDE
jgi:hypothetical protein|tara:strand:- start:186 stop:389 length:204 start_codon:yes stop_codon:yes gene_type:complete